MAGISISSKTSDSVTLYLSNLDESWTNGTRTVYWYLGYGDSGIPSESAYYKTDTASLEDGKPSGGYVTFDGLEPGTEYGICCTIYHGSEFLKELTGWVTTDYEDSGGEGTETTVNKWSWFSSNGSATDLQTINSFGALRRNEPTINFSYKVWNDMVDKVKEILDVADGSWYSDYATYANTRMSSSDRKLTAARFNSLRYNIGSRYSTGIDEVNPGDPVLGSYFITLTDCINGWIDELSN